MTERVNKGWGETSSALLQISLRIAQLSLFLAQPTFLEVLRIQDLPDWGFVLIDIVDRLDEGIIAQILETVI